MGGALEFLLAEVSMVSIGVLVELNFELSVLAIVKF